MFCSFQTVHTYLMETYGLPIWGSYIIFALFTIVLGALLGLVNSFSPLAKSMILIGYVFAAACLHY
jgi:hypothetical protein